MINFSIFYYNFNYLVPIVLFYLLTLYFYLEPTVVTGTLSFYFCYDF